MNQNLILKNNKGRTMLQTTLYQKNKESGRLVEKVGSIEQNKFVVSHDIKRMTRMVTVVSSLATTFVVWSPLSQAFTHHFTWTKRRGAWPLSLSSTQPCMMQERSQSYRPWSRKRACWKFRRCKTMVAPQLCRESVGDITTDLPSPTNMRVKEIQLELKERNVDYADCFDKESLTKRLMEARSAFNNEEDMTPSGNSGEQGMAAGIASREEKVSPPTPSDPEGGPPTRAIFDRSAVIADLRKMRVSELRTQLGERNIRWSNMIEKDELVTALANTMEAVACFSASGAMYPGRANEITGKQLSVEIKGGIDLGTPLLVDCYATWCGPCQLMAPQLEAAAKELGDKVRVAKIDSDKFPEWSSRLKVGGLPTVVLFSTSGNEIARQEGALMKNMILDFVRPHIK